MRRSGIDLLVRDNIYNLKPYSTARDETDKKFALFLDANESPYNTGFNRYPDPVSYKLKDAAARACNQGQTPVPRNSWNGGLTPIYADAGIGGCNVFAGSGSDEAIDLLIRIFCYPGRDNVLSVFPTYGMYRVAAGVNDVEYREVPLNDDFSLNGDLLLERADDNSKIIFLCSPNNPSGNLLCKKEVMRVVKSFNGIVVVDEAYIDFSGDDGMIPEIADNQNLVVLRTMSKSRGMAAIRVGFAFADKKIISYLERVKYPYNLNRLSQEYAIKALEKGSSDVVKSIINEREKLSLELKKLSIVKDVTKSDSNFLLVKFINPKEVYSLLENKGIIVRDRSNVKGCEGCLRITVGKPIDNEMLLKALKGEGDVFFRESIDITRLTKETSVSLKVFPQFEGNSSILTGVGFLDHMLEIFTLHSGVVLDLYASGDLEVDAHHTIEDVAIVFGEALNKLYTHKEGYNRYGFVLPMDESEAKVVVDLGGRAGLKWNVLFKGESVGDFPCEMFEHFFKTLSTSGKFTLHVDAAGDNDHHIAEAVFKAFARAMRIALSNNINEYQLPSSKGLI